MGARLNPYLTFPGTARDAMTFYQQVLGGDLNVSTFGEFGDPGAPGADGVMHAQLETPDGFVLMASDTRPGEE
ncbi:MAG TPA: VOC family protein, partial [Phycicoccus sp.]